MIDAVVEPDSGEDASGVPSTGPGISQPVLAGLVSGLVGFTSSFAVVLTGLAAVGANPSQAASALTVLSITMGLGCLVFSWLHRMPITVAWSTPGAALLATAVAPQGGFAVAVGAFVVCGVLLALTGLVKPLGAAVRAIPAPLAQAMLAGVILHLVAEPFAALGARPWAIAPVLVVWLLMLKLARRWAVPAALLAAVVVMVVSGTFTGLSVDWALHLEWVTPRFDLAAVVALALPLYIVTMTSQNIPGVAVLASFGYRPPVGPPLVYTGLASVAGAFFGGHAINLAAISAALAAGPEAHPDARRRWIAGVSCGLTYVTFGVLSAAIVGVSAAAPQGLLAAVAGVALLGTFASSAAGALKENSTREAAALTLVVAASGLAWGGIGAAFWALVIGLVFHTLMRTHRRRA